MNGQNKPGFRIQGIHKNGTFGLLFKIRNQGTALRNSDRISGENTSNLIQSI